MFLTKLKAFFFGFEYQSAAMEQRYTASREVHDLVVLNIWCTTIIVLSLCAVATSTANYGLDFDYVLHCSFLFPILICTLTLIVANVFSAIRAHITYLICIATAALFLFLAWVMQRFTGCIAQRLHLLTKGHSILLPPQPSVVKWMPCVQASWRFPCTSLSSQKVIFLPHCGALPRTPHECGQDGNPHPPVVFLSAAFVTMSATQRVSELVVVGSALSEHSVALFSRGASCFDCLVRAFFGGSAPAVTLHSMRPTLKGRLAAISHVYWEGILKHEGPQQHTLTRCECAISNTSPI